MGCTLRYNCIQSEPWPIQILRFDTRCSVLSHNMLLIRGHLYKVSWHGNAFHVTDPLGRESNIDQWIPIKKGKLCGLSMILSFSLAWISCWRHSLVSGNLKRFNVHVTVITTVPSIRINHRHLHRHYYNRATPPQPSSLLLISSSPFHTIFHTLRNPRCTPM